MECSQRVPLATPLNPPPPIRIYLISLDITVIKNLNNLHLIGAIVLSDLFSQHEHSIISPDFFIQGCI